MFSAWVIFNIVASVKFKVLVINIWSYYSCTSEKIVLWYITNIAPAAGVFWQCNRVHFLNTTVVKKSYQGSLVSTGLHTIYALLSATQCSSLRATTITDDNVIRMGPIDLIG